MLTQRDKVALLAYEAKRRPHIQALLDRAGSLTDEEIEQAVVPLAWYKVALREARARAQSVILANEFTAMCEEAERLFGPPVADWSNSAAVATGYWGKFSGADGWYKTSTGLEVMVKCGDMIFFPNTGGAWINQIYFFTVPDEFRFCDKTGEGSRNEYIAALHKDLALFY